MKTNRVLYFILVWIPDVLIAWGFMKLTDGDRSTFWWALIILIVVQVLFSIKNTIAGTLIYRLIGRNDLINAMALFLRENNFPDPKGETDIECYYWDVAADDTQPLELRLLARQEFGKIATLGNLGFFPRLRLLSAFNKALSQYKNPKNMGITEW